MLNKVQVLYEKQRQSIPQIAEALNLSRSRVRRMLIDAGVQLRSRAEGIALRRGRLREWGRTRPRTPQSEKTKQSLREKALARPGKGVNLSSQGYLRLTRGSKVDKRLHRDIVEQALGRLLSKDEVVHHIDGNKLNNDLSNLQVLSPSEHARLHALQRTMPRDQAGRYTNA